MIEINIKYYSYYDLNNLINVNYINNINHENIKVDKKSHTTYYIRYKYDMAKKHYLLILVK